MVLAVQRTVGAEWQLDANQSLVVGATGCLLVELLGQVETIATPLELCAELCRLAERTQWLREHPASVSQSP